MTKVGEKLHKVTRDQPGWLSQIAEKLKNIKNKTHDDKVQEIEKIVEKKNFIQSWIDKRQKAKIEAFEPLPMRANQLNLEQTIDRNSLEATTLALKETPFIQTKDF